MANDNRPRPSIIDSMPPEATRDEVAAVLRQMEKNLVALISLVKTTATEMNDALALLLIESFEHREAILRTTAETLKEIGDTRTDFEWPEK